MVSASVVILEWVCPAAGMVLGNIMFFAPFRDVRRATRNGQLGDLNPTPWAFMLGNCCGWVSYSFLLDNLFLYFGNMPGLILSVWLNIQAAKLHYEHHRSLATRKSIVLALEDRECNRSCRSGLGEVLNEKKNDDDCGGDDNDEEGKVTETTTTAAAPPPPPFSETRTSSSSTTTNMDALDYATVVWNVASQKVKAPAPHENLVVIIITIWIAIISTVLFGREVLSANVQEFIVGMGCNLNLVFFYGAPLSTIMTVLKTRSSASIHLPSMLTSTANGAFWCAYGIAVNNFFM